MDERSRLPDWKRAVETNRGIDEAVADYEQALRAEWHRLHDQARLRPVEDAPNRPAVRATASFGTTPLRSVTGLIAAPPSNPPAPAPQPLSASPTAPPRPVVVPLPPPAASRNGPGGVPEHRVPVDAVAAQIAAAIDALRTRAAGAEAQGFPDPWTGKPRPLFTEGENGDVRPNPYTDEEIRDRIQPHWRAVRTVADNATAAREEAERAFAAANPFRRIGAARRALAAAREVEAEARQAAEALETIWSSESMRRQFEHDRAVADEAFRRAMDAAVGAPDLSQRLAALEEEREFTVRLIDHGVSVIGARPGETRAQALARAVAALPVPSPADVTGTVLTQEDALVPETAAPPAADS